MERTRAQAGIEVSGEEGIMTTMKTSVLFFLENGDAIVGNKLGELGCISKEVLDGPLSEASSKIIMASPNTKSFVIPFACPAYSSGYDRETIELNTYIVAGHKVQCGYGKLSDTWIIKGPRTIQANLPQQV